MSWWPHRNDTDVLWLFYEDIIADRRSAIRKIAAFMNIDISTTLPSLPTALTSSNNWPTLSGTTATLEDVTFVMSDATFMKQFETKFDEHIVWRHCRYRMGIDWSSCPFETPPNLTKVKQLLKKEKAATTTIGALTVVENIIILQIKTVCMCIHPHFVKLYVIAFIDCMCVCIIYLPMSR